MSLLKKGKSKKKGLKGGKGLDSGSDESGVFGLGPSKPKPDGLELGLGLGLGLGLDKPKLSGDLGLEEPRIHNIHKNRAMLDVSTYERELIPDLPMPANDPPFLDNKPSRKDRKLKDKKGGKSESAKDIAAKEKSKKSESETEPETKKESPIKSKTKEAADKDKNQNLVVESIHVLPPKNKSVPEVTPKKDVALDNQAKKKSVPVETPKKEVTPEIQAKKKSVPEEIPKKEVAPENPKKKSVPVETPKSDAENQPKKKSMPEMLTKTSIPTDSQRKEVTILEPIKATINKIDITSTATAGKQALKHLPAKSSLKKEDTDDDFELTVILPVKSSRITSIGQPLPGVTPVKEVPHAVTAKDGVPHKIPSPPNHVVPTKVDSPSKDTSPPKVHTHHAVSPKIDTSEASPKMNPPPKHDINVVAPKEAIPAKVEILPKIATIPVSPNKDALGNIRASSEPNTHRISTSSAAGGGPVRRASGTGNLLTVPSPKVVKIKSHDKLSGEQTKNLSATTTPTLGNQVGIKKPPYSDSPEESGKENETGRSQAKKTDVAKNKWDDRRVSDMDSDSGEGEEDDDEEDEDDEEGETDEEEEIETNHPSPEILKALGIPQTPENFRGTCKIQKDQYGNPCFITIDVPRQVCDDMTAVAEKYAREAPPEIYYVNPDVVQLVVKLLSQYDPLMQPPDAFLSKELKKMVSWNEYDLYLTIEIFFGCLDREDPIQIVISTFKQTNLVKWIEEITKKDDCEFKVISFIIMYEAVRIDLENMLTIFADFNEKPAMAYFEFLLLQTYPKSIIRKVLETYYVDDFVDTLILPNLNHVKNVLKKLLGRFEFIKPGEEGKYNKNNRVIYDYIPFQHRHLNEPMVHDCCMEYHYEPDKEFTAGAVPMSTYEDPGVSEHLEQEFARNRAKADELLGTVKNLKHVSSLYDENQKSEKYFRIINEIKEEREAALRADPRPIDRMPLQKVLEEPAFRGKWNTSMVMRQLQTYRNRHEKECQQIAELMKGSIGAINHERIAEAEEEEAEMEMAIRWSRMLDAKLTYQRAIAATQDVADRNKEKADAVRAETEKLNEANAKNKEIEAEKIRRHAKSILAKEMSNVGKKRLEKMQARKLVQARRMKTQIQKNLLLTRMKEEESLVVRDEKISRIRADKSIMYHTKYLVNNPFRINKYGGMSQMSDAETHLRLEMNLREDAMSLVMSKAKIRDERQEKNFRLRGALEELEWYRQQHGLAMRKRR